MSLTRLSALLLVGQLVTVAVAQWSCSDQLLALTCVRADEIRQSVICNREHPTGVNRPLEEPPIAPYINTCICSSTYYSTVSACQLCRGAQPLTWAGWAGGCGASNRNGHDGYPELQYPAWAKLRYDDNEAFSVARLQREGLWPENWPTPPPPQQPSQPPADGEQSSPAPPLPSVTATGTSPSANVSSTLRPSSAQSSLIAEDGSVTTSLSASSTSPIVTSPFSSTIPNNPNVPNPSDDPGGIGPSSTRLAGNNALPNQGPSSESGSSKSTNVGAIVGGVVGGLFLILSIAGLLYFFVLRRRRNRTPPSAAYMAQFGDGRVISPRPFTPDAAAPMPLHSTTNSMEDALPPRPSTDMQPQYAPVSQHRANSQDPFNPAENAAQMREANNVSRQSTRHYTRTPTPLIGPRALR